MENRWIRAACVGDTEELKRLLGLGMEAGRYLLFDSGMVSPVAEHVTALHLSAFGGHLEASQVLLRAGAEVNALTLPMEGIAGGDTPLMRAVWGHSEDVARLLLAAGAEVDAIDGLTGDTPLMAAARTGQPAMCLVLLEQGADLEAFNQDGEGVLDSPTIRKPWRCFKPGVRLRMPSGWRWRGPLLLPLPPGRGCKGSKEKPGTSPGFSCRSAGSEAHRALTVCCWRSAPAPTPTVVL